VSDAQLTVCTACGKATFSKMLTAAGFQLKGSGWYATDFKSKGAAPTSKGEAKPDGGDKSAAESKAESTTESKSASKTESKSESKSDGASSAPSAGSGGRAACS